jgi:2-polyprenyl-6-methoxyphenol hydroxylase-like FAD-dependent oxidoreductase
MPADLFDGDGIVPEIEIMRGDLSLILYDATSSNVEYVFGDRITRLTQDDDAVDVVFASGAARRFDPVVGADGVHCGVRALAFEPGPATYATSARTRRTSPCRTPATWRTDRIVGGKSVR